MLLSRFLAVSIYLLIDILYVTFSKGFYEASVRNISGSSFPKFTLDRMITAVLSYTALGLGWFYLVAPTIENTRSITQVLSIAFLYAFAVYGVYNFTLYTIFKNYTVDVVIRDLLWGMTAISTLSVVYFWYVQKAKKE